MPDRTKPPIIHNAVEFNYILPAIQQITLNNSIPVFWIDSGVQDVVEIDFVFPAGLWYETKPEVATATASLIKSGTSTLTSQSLNEAIEFYGASLNVHAGNDYATISLYTLTKHLPKLLPVLFDIFTDAQFPEEELAIYKQNMIQQLMVHLKQGDFVANQQIDALLFGPTHPYGRYTEKEKVEAVTREDLLEFYQTHFGLAGMKIFMAGHISGKEVAYLNEHLGKHTLVSIPLKGGIFESFIAEERKQHLINDPNGVQSAIRIGSVFPNRHHPDFSPMVILNTVFGGYFGSRLMSNIREDKGYTYGIYSSLNTYRFGGSIMVQTEVGRDVADAALQEIYDEMAKICKEPIPESELTLVKNYLLGNLLGDLDSPFSILRRWRTLILNDMSDTDFNQQVHIYKTITAEPLLWLAEKYFDRNRFYEVVVV